MAQKKHITLFGATGSIGQELLGFLSQAQIPTIAVTRDKTKATPMPMVEWIQADMSNQSSLAKTMKNSRAVFLLSSISKNFVQEQINVIKTAKAEGIEHIVKLSSGAADSHSPFYIPKVHGEVENFLKASGVFWTMLQPNGIMQNWLKDTASTVKAERKLYEATGEGKRAHVDRRDIAEVAFKILCTPSLHQNKSYLLTSDLAVNYTQIAEAIGKAINEKVAFVPLTLEEAKLQMTEAGMPVFLADTFISYDQAQRDGQTAMVTEHVSTILGKPARTLEGFVRDYVDYFK